MDDVVFVFSLRKNTDKQLFFYKVKIKQYVFNPNRFLKLIGDRRKVISSLKNFINFQTFFELKYGLVYIHLRCLIPDNLEVANQDL